MNILVHTQGTPDIKIVTGVRRCGKSIIKTASKEGVIEEGENKMWEIHEFPIMGIMRRGNG